MAGTTTPPSADPIGDTAGSGSRRLAVACSGGLDSTALLHATARAAAELGGVAVVALHVHHGLNPEADAWLAHVQAQCDAWAKAGLPVSLRWRRLQLPLSPGDSIEAVAREGRYAALQEMATQAGCDTVLLAHHRQDQAETFLLQALRGAGVAGLAAMPREVVRQGVCWLRPWLHHSRETIAAYAAFHGLRHVDDDSNRDPRFARNRLRHAVWPALQQAFGHAESGLAAAARRQADVLACRNEWLADRLPLLTHGQPGSASYVLDLTAWGRCSPAAQRELLRAWFLAASGHALTAAWVSRLQTEMAAMGGQGARCWTITPRRPATEGAPTVVGELHAHRDRLSWAARHTVADDNKAAGALAGDRQAAMSDDGGLVTGPMPLHIRAPGTVELPGGLGLLYVQPVDRHGLPLALLSACELRPREGGEQFQLGPGRPARSLKKQYQALGVPPWARRGPLLWGQGRLLFVPGLGVDARAFAAPGEPQVALRWEPAAG